MKTAYICSPYSGDIKRNKEYARELTMQAIKDGYAPITPHLYITECLNDNEPLERDLGLKIAIDLLQKCDAIYIGRKYGVSEGMKAEIIIARSLEMEEKNVESGADFSEC
jgi:hypothetical protein